MRTRADRIMAVGGLLVILATTPLIAKTPVQLAGILGSILMISAGLSGLGHRLQPSSRIFLQLRAEVDQFLTLVRKINVHAAAAEGEQASLTKAAMHESVNRIALVAGVVDVESSSGKRWPKRAVKKRVEKLVTGAPRLPLYPPAVGHGRNIAVVQTHDNGPRPPARPVV